MQWQVGETQIIPSQEPSAHQRPICTRPEEHRAQRQAGTQTVNSIEGTPSPVFARAVPGDLHPLCPGVTPILLSQPLSIFWTLGRRGPRVDGASSLSKHLSRCQLLYGDEVLKGSCVWMPLNGETGMSETKCQRPVWPWCSTWSGCGCEH